MFPGSNVYRRDLHARFRVILLVVNVTLESLVAIRILRRFLIDSPP